MTRVDARSDANRMSVPRPEAIRTQLDRIITSSDFAVPERLRRFLGYVVTESLAGRADRIKAYAIGVEVFGRDESFDPQAEPVVRIEAGRLRRALEHYYLTAGREDAVLITIPKGGYVPVFAQRLQPAGAAPHPSDLAAKAPDDTVWWRRQQPAVAIPAIVAALCIALGMFYWLMAGRSEPDVPMADAPAIMPDGPVLLVTPFADLGGSPEAGLYATGLTEEVLTQLARFKELGVLGRETSRSVAVPLALAGLRELGADYVLEGGVRIASGRARVTARLVDVETAAIVWSQAYDEDLGVRAMLAIEESVASEVAAAVAQPYGAVFRTDARRRPNAPPEDVAAYACTLRFYAYRAELSAEQHARVRDCLEQAVLHFPDYATAQAMLSFLYLDEDRFGFNARTGEPVPLDRALETARHAVALDPQNARALQALMTVLFFRQEAQEALRVGERALALNPNDTELLAEYGTRLAQSGEWERGTTLIEQALVRNPGHSGYYRGILALCAYMRRDYDRALAEVRGANIERFGIYQGVAAIIYAELGMVAEATRAGNLFARIAPAFLANIDAELAKRNFRSQDAARIVDGLLKAGVTVPGRAAIVSH